jgi:glucose dehydrogenase
MEAADPGRAAPIRAIHIPGDIHAEVHEPAGAARHAHHVRRLGGRGQPRIDDPNNWPQYHRSYNAWRYSPLDQINKGNIKKLRVAWIHQPAR